MNKIIKAGLSALLLSQVALTGVANAQEITKTVPVSQQTQFKTEKIDGLDIFYREAGSRNNPTLLLLHGFPTSSHMFRNLIPKLLA